jgi:hypothetical protein
VDSLAHGLLRSLLAQLSAPLPPTLNLRSLSRCVLLRVTLLEAPVSALRRAARHTLPPAEFHVALRAMTDRLLATPLVVPSQGTLAVAAFAEALSARGARPINRKLFKGMPHPTSAAEAMGLIDEDRGVLRGIRPNR